MSTADWPLMWGKQHEAVCSLNAIIARKLKAGEVELWKLSGTDVVQWSCIGVVPEDISYQVLQVIITAMTNSYYRGFSDGQSALASSVLAPINAVLQQTK